MAKWTLAVALLVVPVVVVGGSVGSNLGLLPAPDDELWNSLVWQGWFAWLVLYLMAAVWAAKDAFGMLRQRDLDGLRRAAMLVKLTSIPFFILNFVLLTVIAMALSITGIGVVLAPIFVASTYVIMLSTSVYGVCCLTLMHRDRAISTTFLTVNVILHLIFIVDIVSTLVVAHRAKRVLDRTS